MYIYYREIRRNWLPHPTLLHGGLTPGAHAGARDGQGQPARATTLYPPGCARNVEIAQKEAASKDEEEEKRSKAKKKKKNVCAMYLADVHVE